MPRAPSASPRPRATTARIAVAREELAVGKRKVPAGGVRIRTKVREQARDIEMRLEGDEVEVSRHAVGREVPGPVAPRQEGDTLVVSVVEEVLHVEKRYVLKEEVRIRRRAVARTHRERVVLRGEQAEVEELPAPHRPEPVTPRRR